jgi:hypothetical protein
VRQVAHFIGDHGKAASGLAGASRFDGGVECQQVGLLGDALDHLKDLPDVHRLAVQGFDIAARGADFAGQLVHRLNSFLHRLAPILSLLAGLRGLTGGISSVARDFLSGGAQLINRRGYAVGMTGLLVRVDHRRIGGTDYQFGHFVDLAGGR